jgi:hypothetical protein
VSAWHVTLRHLSSPAGRRLARRAVVAALLAVAAYVFTYRIGAQSMWLDEIYHRHIGLQPARVLLHEGPLEWVQLSHLYYLTGQWCENLLGDPDLGVRLPQALSAVGAVLCAYLLGRHLCSTGAGIIAMVALIGSPLFVGYAQQNRFYHMACLGFLASYYCFVMFCDTGRPRYWAGFVIAASLFLRVNSFGIIIVGMYGLLAVVIYVCAVIARSRAFYDVNLRRLGWIVLAGLVIGLLFMPYPLRLVKHFLERGTSAKAVDKFWTGPFPLTVQALVSFVRTRFVRADAGLLSPWWYLVPLAAALVGSIRDGRGRIVVFCGFAALASLPIIHAMNQAQAEVMEKRFLYLTPVLFITMAAGLAVLVRCGGAAARRAWQWHAQRRQRRRGAGLECVVGVVAQACLWLLVLRVFVMPVSVRAGYDIGQYFVTERAPYKTLAEVFKAHYRSTDALWWHPPRNDAWLMTAYMPTGVFLSQDELYHPYPQPGIGPGRAEVEAVLADHGGLWLHQLNPASYGYRPGQFVELPLSRRRTYLLRPAYLTNAAVCRADQEQILAHALDAARLPEVAASKVLAHLRLARGATSAADEVMLELGAWHASYPATEAATDYFLQRGLTNTAMRFTRALATRYCFVPWLQARMAQQAYQVGEYALSHRCARRAAWLAPDPDGRIAELIGYSARGLSNDARAAAWLGRAAALIAARAPDDAHLRERYRRVYGDFVEASIRSGTARRADGGYIAGWLRVAEWWRGDPLAVQTALRDALGEITHNATNWTSFVQAARQVDDEPELELFVALLRTEPYSADERAALEALRDSVRLQWWPLYVFAIEMLTPLEWREELVIPWTELDARGFDFATLPRDAIEWLGTFYQSQLGWGAAGQFYGYIATRCPAHAAWCALQRAELHRRHGYAANAVAVLEGARDGLRQDRELAAAAARLRAAIGDAALNP